MREKEALLWLVTVKNMWDEKMEKLLAYFGSAAALYEASEKKIRECPLFLGKTEEADMLLESRRTAAPKAMMESLHRSGIHFLTWEDTLFPQKLKEIQNAPRVLFAMGQAELLANGPKPAVAVIGARVCSNYGKCMAGRLSKELVGQGVFVVSGMARGIDSAAHQGALDGGGSTIAVLGNGPDYCYPPENRYLYESILKQGLVLSEYMPGTRPAAWRFPKRNRIISGLADTIVITEAREKSGSLITAKHALEQGREVGAVPGRIDDPLSAGCNLLIRDGAFPVLDVSDILFSLGLNYKILKKDEKFLEKENEVVYSVLGLHPFSMEEIMQKTGMKSEELYPILLELQLMELIEEPVKNYYVRKNS